MNVATGLLGGHAYFFHWGVIQISAANLVVILLMIAVFVLALLMPFPNPDRDDHVEGHSDDTR
jgi:hypothetical protein